MAAINTALRIHETSEDWEYQELAKICFDAFDLFNAAFFESQLPPCLLNFDSIHYKKKGCAQSGTNGIGVHSEIKLNIKD